RAPRWSKAQRRAQSRSKLRRDRAKQFRSRETLMAFLTLDPGLALWLIAAEEEARCEGRPGRYAEAASGQKIFYEPLSITQDLVLEEAFAARGASAPTVAEARATFDAVKTEVDRYSF